MNPWLSGENTTWPNDPAAVARPRASDRRSGPTALAMATMASEKAVSATPIPTISPAVRCRKRVSCACAIPHTPTE